MSDWRPRLIRGQSQWDPAPNPLCIPVSNHNAIVYNGFNDDEGTGTNTAALGLVGTTVGDILIITIAVENNATVFNVPAGYQTRNIYRNPVSGALAIFTRHSPGIDPAVVCSWDISQDYVAIIQYDTPTGAPAPMVIDADTAVINNLDNITLAPPLDPYWSAINTETAYLMWQMATGSYAAILLDSSGMSTTFRRTSPNNLVTQWGWSSDRPFGVGPYVIGNVDYAPDIRPRIAAGFAITRCG